MRRHAGLAVALLVAGLFTTPPAATAETYRAIVEVERPAAAVGRAFTEALTPRARRAFAERYMSARLSPVLVANRGDRLDEALGPIERLVVGFTMDDWNEVSGNRVRVTCHADVDLAGMVLRLVQGGVLSFGRAAPRLLLLPADDASPEAFALVRSHVSAALQGTGIVLADGDRVRQPESWFDRSGEVKRREVAEAAIDAGAHFVAVARLSATPVPTTVRAVVLDGSIQMTLLRMYDGAVLWEQPFAAREGGATAGHAMGLVLAQAGPPAAKGLAANLVAAIFANGRVIDGSRPPTTVTVNVMRRPNAEATRALIELLRERGYAPVLGPGRATASGVVPADRLAIEGRVSDGEIFEVLADSHFGPGGALFAAVRDHGADSLSVDIIDAREPPPAPPVAPTSSSVTLTATAGLEVTTTRTGQAEPPPAAPPHALPPSPPRRSSPPPSTVVRGGAVGAVGGTSGGASTGVSGGVAVAMQTPTPLEFEFSAAFEDARKAGKVVAR